MGFPDRGGADEELREEIDFYLEERARELEAAGMAPEEARREARKAFGDVDGTLSELRRIDRRRRGEQAVRRALGGLLGDVRWALRTHLRNGGSTLAILVTLALGIGATTAIFGVVEGVFLRTPPVGEPGELVGLYTTCRDGHPFCSTSWPDLVDYRERSDLLAGLAGYSWLPVSLGNADGASAERRTAMLVTGDYFTILGVGTASGRPLLPSDDEVGAPERVLVLAHDTWATRWGGDPDVVGRSVSVNGVPFEIVGVAPEGFRGTGLTSDPDLFIPLSAGSLLGVGSVAEEGVWENRGERWIDALVGRLRPGATVDALRTEMAAVATQLESAYPDDRAGRGVTVEPAGRYTLPQFGREGLTRFVALLAGLVALALLLASANVANLLLARASARDREMGVRLSLGAGRHVLARQLVVESLVLGIAGGALGLLVGRATLGFLRIFQLPGGVRLSHLDVGLSGRVFVFTLAASLLTALLFGAAPAFRARRADPAGLVGGTGQAGPQAGRAGGDRLRGTLVGVQIALSLALVMGAGLFLRTLQEGLRWDTGMDEEHVAVLRFDLSVLRLSPEEGMQVIDRLLDHAAALPGAEAVAVTTKVPLQDGGNRGIFFEAPGYEPGEDEELRAEYAVVSGDLPGALGADGGDGGLRDPGGEEGPPAVLVSRSLADRYFGGRASGRTLLLGGSEASVAGVVPDLPWRTVRQAPLNFVLVPLSALPSAAVSAPLGLVVRTTGDPELLLPALRDALASAEPRAAVIEAGTMEDLIGVVLAPVRLGTILLSALGTLSLVLAVVGVGGAVAFAVARRRKEIGVRMALGATSRRIRWLAVRWIRLPLLLGLLGGTALALVLGRVAGSVLVGARAVEPLLLGSVVALLAGATLVAALVPATAATRTDPMRELGAE